eukprot:TRINITY_DN3675_c0_g1_i1.p1 TRINITY_DN3675_c0_g1~~TRINITY_DN3675_c0_g1_i1.p1  ORF type:complete len:410 (-),score=32.30 TRINITY_DN3675_c0_g1_i1:22-1215(-)
MASPNPDDDSDIELALMAYIVSCLAPKYDTEPAHNSGLTGEAYVNSLITGNPRTFYEAMGMSLPAFNKLCEVLSEKGGLRATLAISIQEQIAIFTHVCKVEGRLRTNGRRFIHSLDTLSSCVVKVIMALMRVSNLYIQTRVAADEIPFEVHSNPLYQFFEGALGAIDGSHIPATVPEADTQRFRNRKGFISQNVFAACNFDMTFCFIHAGWEGSAHDGRVLKDAMEKGFTIPARRYYLADAGYPLTLQFLTPYRGVRYHLKEQVEAINSGILPQNKEELFNLRHAKLRNVIERVFGAFKHKFPILHYGSQYPFLIQVYLVYALATLWNFLKMFDNGDEEYEDEEEEEEEENSIDVDEHEVHVDVREVDVHTEAWRQREKIATDMWVAYEHDARRRLY